MYGPGRPGGEALDPPGGTRSVICRIAESSKVTFKFDENTATKLLMHPTPCSAAEPTRPGSIRPRARSARLVCPRIQLLRPWTSGTNSSLLEEAVYAMNALAGDTRAIAHYMELYNKDVARHAT